MNFLIELHITLQRMKYEFDIITIISIKFDQTSFINSSCLDFKIVILAGILNRTA